MFMLTKISDLVQIEPADLRKPSAEAIEDNINAKYANKVIQKIGLCICLYDILWTSEGLIGHGTGLVNVNVEFRLIVFRPFKHEILIGRVSSSDQYGINIRTQFFTSIKVPLRMLPDGAWFNHAEQVWVWSPDGSHLFYDIGDTIRCRVEEEQWVDQSPLGPNEDPYESRKMPPYALIASMGEDGLGPVLWWD